VCLCVEDPIIQIENVIVTEEEPEVLEGFGHDEALLDIILGGVHIVHISDTRITA